MQTLRARLVLSHLLPMLVVVPLMGIALIYMLETRVILPGLSRAYSGNGALVAEITRDHYRLWTDPAYAQTILTQVSAKLPARVMFITFDGRLLASSDPQDAESQYAYVINPLLLEAQNGRTVQQVYYNQRLQGEALDVWVPVIDPALGVIGIVRMTYKFTSILDEFVQLRTMIVVVLLIGLAFGGILGFTLAVNIDRPLRRVTQAVNQLAYSEKAEPLPVSGPRELRQLTESVNLLVEKLNNLEVSRRHLLANLVHELGRPLGALRSAVQALTKGADQDRPLYEELTSGMDGEIVRLQGLLGDLTHLYDQGLGNLELDCKPLDLKTWLPGVLSPWQTAAQAKNLNWEVKIPDDLPFVQADADRLAQAVGNLLSNAVKFTQSGGAVQINAGSHIQGVWLQVTDSGPGISKEEQQKIFEPFYRGSQGKRFPEGMGLGLNITRDIIAAHGGQLDVVSQPGKGSQFTIFLPVPKGQ